MIQLAQAKPLPSDAQARGPGSPAYEGLLDRARALVPTLRERAARSEELRRLPPETVRDLHASGLFRFMQPAAVGGSELDYVALIDFPAEMARADASIGWNLGNLGSHHWMLAMFPKAAQEAVWNADPDALIASSFVFPAGRAERVSGGYKISGRWPFSSGVDVCSWNMVGALVAPGEAGGAKEYRIFLIPSSAYRSLDNWDSMGLRGTGSHDVEGSDIFVPEHMTLAVADVAGGATPGSGVHPSAVYRIPVFALFPFVLSGTALGNAQAALDDYVEGARKRASRYSGASIAQFQTVQIAIASAAAKIDTARRIMRSICIDAMEDAKAGRIPDLREKTTFRRDGAFSVNLCTSAVDDLMRVSGASGLYKSMSMERRFRDAHAIEAHIAFSFDAAGANYGRVALGFESDNPTL